MPTYNSIPSSIAPWLSVPNGTRAVDFYKSAFGAVEVYRMDVPDGGLVVTLSVQGAEAGLKSCCSANLTVGGF